MDRSQDTSEPTAAPPAATPAEEKRSAPSLEPASVQAPEASAGVPSGSSDARPAPDSAAPPLPLPPLAFSVHSPAMPEPAIKTPPPSPMPPRIFLRSGPAFAEPRPAPVAGPTHSRGGPAEAALDAVLSEIDAEASSRSLTATERVETDRGSNTSTSRAALNASAAHLNLGSHVPRAVPMLQIPSRTQARAFGGLAVEPVARSPIPARPATFKRTRQSDGGSLLRRIGRIAAWVVAGWLALVLLLMITYRFVNPPASMLMLEHWLLGEKVVNSWVPLENMSPNIIRAVISSEDARFCQHHGVDFGALKEAVEEVGSGSSRGASTISMQVVKNLFLWSSKSYVRKAIELPLTFVMELIWPKRRIMEVYLNIAEWGPGIFGIESASRFRFHKSAKSLSAGQASRLAVALPNPLTRNPARPGPGLQRLARAVQVRMRIAPSSRTSCILPRRRK